MFFINKSKFCIDFMDRRTRVWRAHNVHTQNSWKMSHFKFDMILKMGYILNSGLHTY